MPASPALILFDIDGTLIRRAGPHHRQVLVDAVRRVTGLGTTTDHIPVHGMLDPDILTRMMQDCGASAKLIRRSMPGIIHEAQSLYLRRCPDLRSKLCPGVRPLLQRLRRRECVLGLVTGNLQRIGLKKMEQAGLRQYFSLGAFAGMAVTRSHLAALAIRRAHSRGFIRRPARVTLIGDAPSDIIAAKANGARSIAVATGISTREELLAEGPDLLIQDLTELNPDTV
jgi:phosphoglycolate phosphatase